MCSRFENKETGVSIFERLKKNSNGKFILDDIRDDLKKSGIAPSDEIITVLKEKITCAKWGIKFEANSPNIFNSRIETIDSKPYWNNLFKKNRCLIPATAFYEWKVVDSGSTKLPHRISVNDDLFFIPSLFIIKNNTTMVSMITTEPNDFMKSVHSRMPCLINIDNIEFFLNEDAKTARQLCIPYRNENSMKIEIARDIIKNK